jgi:hypothetical protein
VSALGDVARDFVEVELDGSIKVFADLSGSQSEGGLIGVAGGDDG